MAAEKRMSEELDGFERALATLTPAASGVDRDQLMFLAGRASVEAAGTPRRGGRLWPAAAMMSTVAAGVLAVLLTVEVRRQPPRTPIAADQREPAEKPILDENVNEGPGKSAVQPTPGEVDLQTLALATSERWRQSNYVQLQQLALAHGVEALPLPVHTGSSSPAPPGESFESIRRLRNDGSGNLAPAKQTSIFDRALFFDRGETL
jgi:hypothetical protein